MSSVTRSRHIGWATRQLAGAGGERTIDRDALAGPDAELVAGLDGGDGDVFLATVGGEPVRNHWESAHQVPAQTPQSDAMSKALLKAGFKFVGSTICYAFMQASGMVNDHLVSCHRHAPLAKPSR